MIKIAVEESNQYIFEYDIKTGNLRKKAGTENKLFAQTYFQNVPDSITEADIIADTSLSDFRDLFTRKIHF